MCKLRYSDNQSLGILNQEKAGTSIQYPCREHGVSNAAFYKWRVNWNPLTL